MIPHPLGKEAGAVVVQFMTYAVHCQHPAATSRRPHKPLTSTNRAGDRSRTRDILTTSQHALPRTPPQQPSHLRKRT